MKTKTILEYSRKANIIIDDLERGLEQEAFVRKFTWREPPHDIARQLMNYIVEFQPVLNDKVGG